MPYSLSMNRLLSWALGLFVAYWSFSFVGDPIWWSVYMSACLLVGGVIVSIRAVPDAINLIKRDQIGPGELAVIALALLAVGAIYTGVFALVYNKMGRPDSWVGPFSSFGRAMTALGFFILFLSPDSTHQGVKWPRWYVLVAGALVIAIVSFLIGFSLSAQTQLFGGNLDISNSPRQTDLLLYRRA